MYEISDERFDQLISKAMNELPQEYITGMQNVVITMADEPTDEQIERMKIREGSVLLGLYEGVPLTQRGSGWSGMLPDKITLFKNSILQVVNNDSQLFEQIKRTLWHEIAHYYGLSHNDMHERRSKPTSHSVTPGTEANRSAIPLKAVVIGVLVLILTIYTFSDII